MPPKNQISSNKYIYYILLRAQRKGLHDVKHQHNNGIYLVFLLLFCYVHYTKEQKAFPMIDNLTPNLKRGTSSQCILHDISDTPFTSYRIK